MEVLSQKDKQKYAKGIILNGFFVVLIAAYGFFFIKSEYEEMYATIDESKSLYSDVERMKESGLTVDELSAATPKYANKNALGKEVFSDKDKLAQILKKPAKYQGDYISWIAGEIGTIEKIDQEIERNNMIIGNIIPTFTNVSTDKNENLGKNRLTLRSFIDYIETQILKKYSLESQSPLGINNISFDENKASTVNIGSFKINLDVEGKNSSILDLIASIQKSGKLIIKEGKIIAAVAEKSTSAPSSLSELNNLLITIDSVQFADMLERNELKNKGSISLRFYIKGINYQELLVIRNSIFERIDTLSKNIKQKGGLCQKGNNPICKDSAGNSAVSAIKTLTPDVTALATKAQDMKKNNVITDMNRELENIFSLSSSLQSLEAQYNKYVAIIDKNK